jgi:hypothetical protein
MTEISKIMKNIQSGIAGSFRWTPIIALRRARKLGNIAVDYYRAICGSAWHGGGRGST